MAVALRVGDSVDHRAAQMVAVSPHLALAVRQALDAFEHRTYNTLENDNLAARIFWALPYVPKGIVLGSAT
jgi:hypothetical protein